MLSTVGRAGDVLDLFTAERPEWGVTAAARQLQIPKSRAHDLLASLTAIGLLEHVPHRRYRLGWRSLALAWTQMRSSPLRLQAVPVMREVADGCAVAPLLFVWDRGWMLCVGRQDPTPPIQRGLPSVGARFRADRSAAAMVLLAHRPAGEISALAGTDARSGDPPRSAQFVEYELRRIRRRGVAIGHDAGRPATAAVAAPVRDVGNDVVAALSIAEPETESDADPALYEDVVVGAAARISQALCDGQSCREAIVRRPIAAHRAAVERSGALPLRPAQRG